MRRAHSRELERSNRLERELEDKQALLDDKQALVDRLIKGDVGQAETALAEAVTEHMKTEGALKLRVQEAQDKAMLAEDKATLAEDKGCEWMDRPLVAETTRAAARNLRCTALDEMMHLHYLLPLPGTSTPATYEHLGRARQCGTAIHSLSPEELTGVRKELQTVQKVLNEAHSRKVSQLSETVEDTVHGVTVKSQYMDKLVETNRKLNDSCAFLDQILIKQHIIKTAAVEREWEEHSHEGATRMSKHSL